MRSSGNWRKGSNPFLSANQNLNRIRKCLIWVFPLQKFRFYLCFSAVVVPSFYPFRGSYWCVRIALSVVVADGFMPRKVLDVRKECVRLSCQRQTKSPSGLSVGGLFAYRHAPERLTSRTPWNKSSAYVSDTHYKSEIFKSVILSVLYHIRHFNVFVVKRKTLTFVKVYRLWGVVDNNHFIVIQLNFFY